jgi:Flp pilus assembly protein TadD
MTALTDAKQLNAEVRRDPSKHEVNLAAAQELVQRALLTEPDNIALLTALGTILCDRGLYSEAERALKRAVELGSTDRNTWFALAVATLDMKTHEEAMALFHRAQTLTPSPDTWEAWFDPQSQ